MDNLNNYNPNDISHLSDNDILIKYTTLVKRIALKTIVRLPPNIHIEDLIQVGLMALLDSAKNYDSSKGASFTTYAGIRIKGSMIDEIRREDWLPRSTHRNAKILSDAKDYLDNHNEQDVSTEELCEHLKITEAEYSKLSNSSNNYKIYHFDDIGMEDDNLLGSNAEKDVFSKVENNFLRIAIDKNLAKLPIKERIVLILYYDNELSLKQIGDILSVTESRVCQIHGQAMQHLEKYMSDWA